MEIRQLGRSDLHVSELCLGTMTFGWGADKETSFAIMDRAYEAGVNFLDTADIYSQWAKGNPGGVAEQWIGDWLTDRKPESIIIATKVRGRMWEGRNGEGLSQEHIMRAVEDSLRRLQVESIDLYQTHWPDDVTPLEETQRALDDLVQQGKVRYLGCSNYDADLLEETLSLSQNLGLARFESVQPHYNLVHRNEFEGALQALCEQEAIGVIPYSPLAGGFLTGKYRKGQPLPEGARGQTNERIQNYFAKPRNLDLVERMEEMGAARGSTVAQIAVAWQLSQPHITSSIIGARTVEQLDDVLAGVGLRLEPPEMSLLNDLST